jgi:hypothetical protein
VPPVIDGAVVAGIAEQHLDVNQVVRRAAARRGATAIVRQELPDMAEPLQLTENSRKVAVQLADRWATAAETQARRISAP